MHHGYSVACWIFLQQDKTRVQRFKRVPILVNNHSVMMLVSEINDVTRGCHSQRSTRSGSATHCRSSAGTYWWFQVALNVDSGLCGRWGCGWHKFVDTEPAGAASPGHRFYCTLTTLQYPSWKSKSLVLGKYPWKWTLQQICFSCILFMLWEYLQGQGGIQLWKNHLEYVLRML